MIVFWQNSHCAVTVMGIPDSARLKSNRKVNDNRFGTQKTFFSHQVVRMTGYSTDEPNMGWPRLLRNLWGRWRWRLGAIGLQAAAPPGFAKQTMPPCGTMFLHKVTDSINASMLQSLT